MACRESLDRHIVRLHTRCLCTLSLHAVARRLQRGADASLEALVRDIDIGALVACGTLVDLHWDGVLRIAEALHARGWLDGAEVTTLWRGQSRAA